jgi:malate synthase
VHQSGKTAILLKRTHGSERVITPEALDFLVALHNHFSSRIDHLLEERSKRQKRFDAGELPDFLQETQSIRSGDWKAAPVPDVLKDRRVEITGPVDRKMMINALNCGAKMFMADFEDASSPTFANMIEGQVNMIDYANNRLDYKDPETSKSYILNDKTAVMIVRPRGLHMLEEHLLINGKPIPASLFDFGLHIFHNGVSLHQTGRGPFYYIPKLESHHEAKLWDDVFVFAQDYLNIPHGTIKATVLIETLPAAFEMDEIIHALKDHIAGLNCGRWDYIFSYIKTLRAHDAYVLPDRAQVTMDRDFLKNYSEMLVQICHKRGVHAMGGMAAQIPVKNDDAANKTAFDKVQADKMREAKAGHDGTWVAHPALVPVAMDVFDSLMKDANQISKPASSTHYTQEMLLAPHQGTITEKGVRTNITVCLDYLAAWLGGRGAVPIHNLMEDAATAEISRSQIWQWIRHEAAITDDKGQSVTLTAELFSGLLSQELDRLIERIGPDDFYNYHYPLAARLFREAVLATTLPDFITTPAYDVLFALTYQE